MLRNINLKNIHRRVIFFLILITSTLAASAVKAKPGIIKVDQPDGSVLSIRLIGDEKVRYTLSEDGFLLLQNPEGFYEYAVQNSDRGVVTSGVRATDKAIRSSGEISFLSNIDKNAMLQGIDIQKISLPKFNKHRVATRAGNVSGNGTRYTYSTAAFPVFGEPHSIVVLVEYQDHQFSMPDPRGYFSRMLNQAGFSDNDGTGSVRDYFIDNSMGQFKPTFDVYGPIRLKNMRKYYGAGNEQKAGEMVVEAVESLDDSVNFRNYDHNNDGYVDSIYIIYASYGEADGGPSESVWPYSWELEAEGYKLQVDGVKINAYGCSNELDYKLKKPAGIGTFTHEFGHVIGLPDLYNTVSSSDFSTPLDWNIMDSGNYNNDSHTPANFSAFERYSLGWMDCREILCSGNYSIENLADSNKAFIIPSEENPNEFYLVENRQQKGWDEFLPGHGMLVWHVDFVQKHWDANTVNDNKNHQYVRLVRADNSSNSMDLSAASFPGSKNITEFGWSTTPKLASWKDTPLNVALISNISENNEIISFMAKTLENRSGVDSVLNDSDVILIEGNKIIVKGEGIYPVFDLTGRIVGNASSQNPVVATPGIYIVNNKKFILH